MTATLRDDNDTRNVVNLSNWIYKEPYGEGRAIKYIIAFASPHSAVCRSLPEADKPAYIEDHWTGRDIQDTVNKTFISRERR